jgi:hypothetical protein
VFFKYIFVASGLSIDLGGEAAARFLYTAPLREMTIALRIPREEEMEDFCLKENDVLCEVLCERNPPERALPMFEALSRREVPKGFDRDSTILMPEAFDEDGKLRDIGILTLAGMPATFKNFVENLNEEVRELVARTVAALRWRMGRPQGPRSVTWKPPDWFAFDSVTWFQMPSRLSLRIEFINKPSLTAEIAAEVQKLVQEGMGEPLPHSLFREAWALRSTNPRSALLIGVTAAEVGIKRYVSFLVPEAEWLVNNLPSPPIDSMAKEYLPKLPAKSRIDGKVRQIPSGVLDELKKAIKLRNDTAHQGEFNLKYESLERKLVAIRDLLWLLDFFAGHEWALEYVTNETRARL